MDNRYKISAVLLSLLLLGSSAASASLNPNTNPSGNFDLSHWYLDLPIGTYPNSNQTIPPSQLVAGFTDAYFYTSTNDGSMVFWAPVNGITTSGSTHPRSELREEINGLVDDNAMWNIDQFPVSRMDATCLVSQLPTNSSNVIVGQIHGANFPVVKLVYEGGTKKLVAQINQNIPTNDTEADYTVATNIALSNQFSYEIKTLVSGTGSNETATLVVSVNGNTNLQASVNESAWIVGAPWSKTDPESGAYGFYFKAGSYQQDVQNTNAPTNDGGRTQFYALAVYHELPATITITITNTSQTFSGAAEPVSVTVSPTNATPLSVTYSNANYSVRTNAPTNAGTYSIMASVLNYNYSGSATASLVISPVTITFSETNQTYNGSPLPVYPQPANLPVGVTYSNAGYFSTNAPTNAGVYTVVATVTNGSSSNYTSLTETSSLTIARAPALLALSNTNQSYSGLSEPVSVSVSPTNATPLSITYSNAAYAVSSNAPTNAGVYSVSASVLNSNYTGSLSGSLLISPATPVITISGATNDPYNGQPRAVSATITPSGIPLGITYNGSTGAPSAVGTYAVVASNSADLVNSNWLASSTNATLTIYDPVSLWRQTYYGTTNNSGQAASSAPCGNGLDNNAAYTFGIAPNQPITKPLLSISMIGTNTITLAFTALQAGNGSGYAGLTRYYDLMGTTNPTNPTSWGSIPGYSSIVGSNQTVTLTTNQSGGPKWFFRLKAWLQ